MTEIDIWRSANLLVKRHGKRAEFVATSRIDEMVERGDPAGEATWKRILAAATGLKREKPENGVPVH